MIICYGKGSCGFHMNKCMEAHGSKGTENPWTIKALGWVREYRVSFHSRARASIDGHHGMLFLSDAYREEDKVGQKNMTRK